MSFAFGFNDDDISDEEVSQNLPKQDETNTASKVFQNATSGLDPQFLPQVHSLESILSKLVNVRITFDNYITPIGENVTYRRELYDIKHQVMCEDGEDGKQDDVVNNILMGDDNDLDLKRNVYEGGFKSWECSYDVVDYLVENKDSLKKLHTILELGCGTSLPSCQALLQRITSSEDPTVGFKIILSDFNYEVLRLVTIPNLIIHWASTLDPALLQELCNTSVEGSDDGPILRNDEIILSQKLIDRFISDLGNKKIELVFISGSWGQEFLQIIEGENIDLVISSETIYSLETLPIVAETVVELVGGGCRALIAAKNLYFGVGGSVAEFVSYIRNKNREDIKVEVEEVNSQLKRSLISIEKV